MRLEELNLKRKIPENKLKMLNKKGINSVEDLLRCRPRGYYDYSKQTELKDVADKNQYALRLAFRLTVSKCIRKMGKNKPYVKATCVSSDGSIITVIWYDQYIYYKVKEMVKKEVIVAGIYENHNMVSPDVFELYSPELFKIYPIYSKLDGISNEYYLDMINHAIAEYHGEDPFPKKFRETFNIVDEKQMIMYLHRPKSLQDIKKAEKRLAIEKMYPFCQAMYDMAADANIMSNIKPVKIDICHKIIKDLPYNLTDDQKNVLNQFVVSARKGKRINALLQGDVGSGKTICATLLMVSIIENGYQACLMAPTGILAVQHYEEIEKMLSKYNIHVAYLASGMKKSQRNSTLEKIASGEIDLVVATHSVISESVRFKNLGITIIDEEHKFGVIQRQALREKAKEGVHNISMSATPIPRSLAQTIYGNCMDIYTINSMPAGRLPIKTAITKSILSMLEFMKREINAGHQCYIVCPLVETNEEKGNFEEATNKKKEKVYSVEEIEHITNKYFQGSNIKTGVVTGRMKETEKSEIINGFQKNEFQILIATTIIEVGVNVPNTTVIGIINANRFGLAGLHQLRGRVGRNSLQSYCILQSEDKNNPRLRAMCQTTNGFEIAEEDLRLRGTGDIVGIQQSGLDINVMMMLKYPRLYNAMMTYITNERGK